MESAANRLQKEAKGYLDSLRGLYYLFLRNIDPATDHVHSNDSLTNANRRDN